MSKNTPLLILGITALLCSRTMLVAFDDPEGPNLLIVVVMAAVIYVTALALYVYSPKVKSMSLKSASPRLSLTTLTSLKRLLLVIVIQLLLATTFYFCLR